MSVVSAADVMDRMYRHQRHVYDATRKYYLLGRDRLIRRLGLGAGMRALEIGCGTGRNLVLAAHRYPDARFFGVDVSAQMLQVAARAIARRSLAGRVRVAQADATGFQSLRVFGTAAFDRIFISYTLSMIPNWPSVLDRAMAALAPGGELHIVDFGGQERLPSWFRGLLRRWLALFGVVPCDRLESELARRAAQHGALVLFQRPFLGYAQYVVVRLPTTDA